jgi:hypothetical protein
MRRYTNYGFAAAPAFLRREAAGAEAESSHVPASRASIPLPPAGESSSSDEAMVAADAIPAGIVSSKVTSHEDYVPDSDIDMVIAMVQERSVYTDNYDAEQCRKRGIQQQPILARHRQRE